VRGAAARDDAGLRTRGLSGAGGPLYRGRPTPSLAPTKHRYEAIVVGTGFGGAVAACRLAQAGVAVAVLERGRRFEPGSFPRPTRGRHDLMHWHCGGAYDVRPLNDVFVVQAAGYGGGSLIYANVQMRPPPDVFDHGWPRVFTRSSLDPYYDLVAHMLDIRPVEPDPASGELPPKTLLMEEAAARLGRSRQSFRPNIAVRFDGGGQPLAANKFGAPQSGCVHCGECDIGCNFGAKNTLDLNYLAVAESMGAEVGTGCEVTRIVPTGDGFDLVYRDRGKGERERTISTGQVFLALGAVNTTELLLRSRDEHATLPRLSPTLGSGYSANGDFLALGTGTSPPFLPRRGPTITTACVFDWEDGHRRIWFAVEEGGYTTYLAHLLPILSPSRLARLLGRELQGRVAGHAEAFTALLDEESDATAVLLVMGRDAANGRIELRGRRHRLHVHWDIPSNLALYAAEAAACRELVNALDGRLALAPNWRFLGQPFSVHNLGGSPMAEREEDGVVDPQGSVFGYPGLHVLDGAIIPTAVGANPSHTIAAVAERAVEAAIRRLPGRERWQAPERAQAARLAPPEDRISIPAGGTVRPAVPAGGLRWHEVMRGTVMLAGVARPVSVKITITVADVAAFVADPAHPGAATGSIHVDGLTRPAGASVEAGTFHLFLDEGDPQARTMQYTLPFHGTDDRRWVLRGIKDVRGRRIIDFWRATTTLAARLETEASGGVGGPGRLRISAPGVAQLLASIRTERCGGRPDQLGAAWRFVQFYASTLTRIYLAGKRTP
jgi:cholesterol oxidase